MDYQHIYSSNRARSEAGFFQMYQREATQQQNKKNGDTFVFFLLLEAKEKLHREGKSSHLSVLPGGSWL